MPNATAKTVEARQKQSEASKRATVDMLLNKPRATQELTLYIKDDNGDEHEVTMLFQSIGAKDYDKLVSKHPPTAEQRSQGATFNMDTFAPALISTCLVEPEMSQAEAKQLWASPDWSRGDLMALFRTAVDINNQGIDIPFNARG